MPYTVPPNNRVSLAPGHLTDHTNISDLLSLGNAYNAKNTVFSGGAKGDGATDDTTALNSALTNVPEGATLIIPFGIYVVSAPLVCNKRLIIVGADAGFGWGIYSGSYPGNSQFEPNPQTGTVIQAAAAWAQGGAAGAGLFVMTTDATHYINEGPTLQNICFSGTTGTGSGGIAMTATADAILAIGPVVNVLLDNVMCMYVKGWGINTAFDASTPSGSSINTPGTWRVRRTCVYACTAGGVNETYVSDSIWDDVLVIGCNGPGWKLLGGGNSTFRSCRAEWNGSHGFWLTGAWESGTGFASMMQFVGCSTDANTGHGMLIDATAGDYNILITGFTPHRDGNVSGGGTAGGLAITQTAAAGLTFRVTVRGMVVTSALAGFATVNPAYGLILNGTGVWIDIDGAYLIGRLGAVSTTGTPARAWYGLGITYWTGSNDAPVAAGGPPGTTTPSDLTVSGVTYVSNLNVFGGLDVKTAGQTLAIAEGTNAKQGTLTLNGTTAVVVANTSVTANSRIHLTTQLGAGTVGAPYVSARTAGTNFSVKSTVAGDTSTVAYTIFEPG